MADSSVLSTSRQSTRFLIQRACLGAIALLALSGCTRLQVRLGAKVHLEAVPVKSMEARLAKGPGIVPGQKSSLVAVITDADGKMPHVTITVPSHPDIRAELDIPVRYDYNFTSNFSGSSGTSGFNGTDGL